ncbi:sulfatase-like hydrolase/transferase [Flavobacterium sediminilitoris]|uniref:Sulfatase-like hydrolase/transferase n=1 Tax=Flavobacterium sediminilitoris TaxID=2024526 RepID=A0ABY4HLW1_9FLAO|nr:MULTISPECIES: alkaline phosphatase family protein [Flavobacterium]UOX33663.1 sulfatase-like hydrolase/transferase [Flavobacterium sediminilitoris]
MQNYFQSVKLFFKRFTLVLFLYQVCRILFYLFNSSNFNAITFKSIIGGLHFDLSAIAYINLLFALFHFIPGNFKYKPSYQKVLKVTFYTVNLIFLLTNFVDFEYYKFTGRRSTFGMITASGMENEIKTLIFSFLSEFWYLPIIAILLSFLFWKSIPTLKIISIQNNTKIQILKQFGFFLLFMGVIFLFGRGGFQKKPLRIVDSVSYGSINQSAFVLNTPFSILKTIGKKETLEAPNFYSEKELNTIFNPVLEINPKGEPTKKNVAIIILESFGRENIQRGQTPFLDSLLTKSLFFENGFANGKLSIDAVPSTLSSIPSLMNHSLITSSYAINNVYGLPKILKDNGYNTSFFHGAFNGSQNFDQYCNVAGFDNYFGKDEYVGPESFDGTWGVFDEDFFQFYCSKMNEFKEPFFTTIFSISSHNPYTIPEKYKGKFPKGTTKIQESIAYTDYALKLFFESAKKQDWYKNTIFVLTADHTSSEATEKKFETNVGKFRVPIAFFNPGDKNFGGISYRNMQQIDIMPSILDLLNIKTKMITFGKPYKSEKDFVVYYLDNIYHYIDGDYYMAFDGKKAIGLYHFKKDELLKTNLLNSNKEIRTKMERFIKAYIQSFNTRLIDNKLVL